MIINHGKLVASDTTENLMNHSLGSNTLELTVKGEKQDVEKMLRDVEEIQKLEWKPGENEKTVSMVITTEEKTDIREKLFLYDGRSQDADLEYAVYKSIPRRHLP